MRHGVEGLCGEDHRGCFPLRDSLRNVGRCLSGNGHLSRLGHLSVKGCLVRQGNLRGKRHLFGVGDLPRQGCLVREGDLPRQGCLAIRLHLCLFPRHGDAGLRIGWGKALPRGLFATVFRRLACWGLFLVLARNLKEQERNHDQADQEQNSKNENDIPHINHGHSFSSGYSWKCCRALMDVLQQRCSRGLLERQGEARGQKSAY